MTENQYPEFHIEKLKSIVRGWALIHPDIERIYLFKSVSAAAMPISEGQREKRNDNNDVNPNSGQDLDQASQPALPTIHRALNDIATNMPTISEAELAAPSSSSIDPLYWIVIVGPEEFNELGEEINTRLQLEWGERSLASELAKCFTEKPEERFVKDSWLIRPILPEEYEDGSWACDDDGYIDEDGNWVPMNPVYFVDPYSELVLFERTGRIERIRPKVEKTLSKSNKDLADKRWSKYHDLMAEALQEADEKWANGDSRWHNEMAKWLVSQERFKKLKQNVKALIKKLKPIADKYGRTRGKKGVKKEK